jgi:hypothetical protein
MGEALQVLRDNPRGRTEREMSSHNRNREWTGVGSFDEALQVAASGWHDVRADMDILLSNIREQFRNVEGLVPRMRFDVAGGEVCIDRYLDGEPEHMREAMLETAPRLGRAVRIAVQTSTSGGVDASVILARGTAVCALVEALALCGIGCEVWAINSISGCDMGVRLSSASDPLDMDAIAFGIAHPAMQRCIYFGLQEQEVDAIRLGCLSGHGGYGGDKSFGMYTGQASAEFLAHMEFDVHISQQSSSGRGLVGDMDTDPVEWIRQTITGLGVELREV